MATYDDQGLHPEARRRLGDRGWRLAHSVWMIPALVGLGALSWVSLVYVAARTRRPAWIALAAALVVGGVVAGFWPEDESNTQGGLLLFVWAAAVVSAFILRPAYLRWRAARDLPATGHAGEPGQAGQPHACWPTATSDGPQDSVQQPGQADRPGSGPVFGPDGRWRTPE